ncbi:MAG TPA: cytochrome c oxidase assembly protein [Pyrinomonadaceae bacterium]|nr:cytochrome c oxidase assembly protein [Pyrinomonadaceae bacterium]
MRAEIDNKRPTPPRILVAGGLVYLRPIVLLLTFASTALAHEGKPHTWHDLWRSWSFEPLVVISLIATAVLFSRGLLKVWRHSGTGKGIRKWEALVFAGGWLALFIALVSPVHAWGRVLFSAHMTQHEILMLVAAPFLVLGRPLIAFLWALPVRWSRRLGAVGKIPRLHQVWKVLTLPIVAWPIHAVALWIWHAPVLFEAVLHNELVHTAQHLSFLLSALLFWWALIKGPQGLMGYGAAALYVFTTSLHSGLLGALLTFSHSVWYPSYIGLTASWGLTPVEDQQVGGLIMWIPAGVCYAVAGLALVAGWLREAEKRALRRERSWVGIS